MADQRLKEAASAGNAALLRQLLEDDPLLLQNQATRASSNISDTPILHIAASLGHLEFVREILSINPDLSRCLDGNGLSALHLASANGHLAVVQELLSSPAATQLCFLRDNRGFMPVHTAAAEDRVDVLRALLDAPLAFLKTRALTSHGDSILHVAVREDSYETVQYLMGRSDVDEELLSRKGEDGNTILHLAVARRQLQIVKLLLDHQGIRVNTTNSRNSTALNVLLDSPIQHGDLPLMELLMAAGGKSATALEDEVIVAIPITSAIEDGVVAIPITSAPEGPVARSQKRSKEIDRYNNKPDTLMLVASLIATITFTAGLKTPGGFISIGDSKSAEAAGLKIKQGTAVLGKKLRYFLIFDMIALFLSLSIILLLICCTPRKKRMVIAPMKWILWLAVFFTALAFSTGTREIYTEEYYYPDILATCWFVILGFFITWLCFRVMRWLLRTCGCWEKENKSGERPDDVVVFFSKISRPMLTVLRKYGYWKKDKAGEKRQRPNKICAFISKSIVAVLTLILLLKIEYFCSRLKFFFSWSRRDGL